MAVVTGGGSGIGRGTCQVLARLGFTVAAVDINGPGAEETARTITAAGGQAMALKADVSDADDVSRAIRQAAEALGGLYALVNCAGVIVEKPLEETRDEDWQRMLNVHLSGTFYACRAAAPLMRQRGGKIVNISSTWALVGQANATAYCAAKAGILGLTKALARELAPWKINVNVVAPGSVNTNMQTGVSPEVIAARIQANPWKRYAEPEEIGAIIAFLCSPEADYITGQVLSPNGGAVIVGI